jgi:hypothetical protein
MVLPPVGIGRNAVAPVPGQEFQKASRAAWRLSKVAIGADLVGEPDAAELAADVVACLGVQDEPSRRIRTLTRLMTSSERRTALA